LKNYLFIEFLLKKKKKKKKKIKKVLGWLIQKKKKKIFFFFTGILDFLFKESFNFFRSKGVKIKIENECYKKRELK
jgi:ABC-type phosphate transport system permease subunit